MIPYEGGMSYRKRHQKMINVFTPKKNADIPTLEILNYSNRRYGDTVLEITIDGERFNIFHGFLTYDHARILFFT
jgi:hypothetical protein